MVPDSILAVAHIRSDAAFVSKSKELHCCMASATVSLERPAESDRLRIDKMPRLWLIEMPVHKSTIRP